jgi:hypothetical protein
MFARNRLCLQEDIREANSEAGEISSRTMSILRDLFHPIVRDGENGTEKSDEKNSGAYEEVGKLGSPTPTRYSMLSTIYFHLLTGPLGSHVRALGDLFAWIATIITKRIRWLLNWRR